MLRMERFLCKPLVVHTQFSMTVYRKINSLANFKSTHEFPRLYILFRFLRHLHSFQIQIKKIGCRVTRSTVMEFLEKEVNSGQRPVGS